LKNIIYILLFVISLFSCSSNDILIEGRLSNLSNADLFVVYESSNGNQFDTVTCNERGKFLIHREYNDNIHSITIYYNDREKWFTVYPEAGKAMQVKGDSRFPTLLQVKGGRINNKLSEFKKKAAPLLKELAIISDDTNLSGSEGSLQLANLNHELRRIMESFINKNLDEEASAVLIAKYLSSPDDIEKQTEEFLNKLSPELYNFFIIKNLRTQIAKAKKTIIGAKAPEFKVTNIYGETITTDSLTDKYYILSFTALWCDMCRTEVMGLNDLTAKYPKDSLDILLISLDDEFDKLREMVRQDTIRWNIVADSASQAIDMFEKYNVSSLPKCYLIDREGKIVLRTTNGVELQQTVDEALK
jgi:Peroxiredoxin